MILCGLTTSVGSGTRVQCHYHHHLAWWGCLPPNSFGSGASNSLSSHYVDNTVSRLPLLAFHVHKNATCFFLFVCFDPLNSTSVLQYTLHGLSHVPGLRLTHRSVLFECSLKFQICGLGDWMGFIQFPKIIFFLHTGEQYNIFLSRCVGMEQFRI